MHSRDPSRPAGRSDLLLRPVDEDLLLYDTFSDEVILLNGSAALVFELCDGTRTADEIAEEVARPFGRDAGRVARDVRSVLAEFAASGLLVGSPGAGTSDETSS